jgi:hypothetical protein
MPGMLAKQPLRRTSFDPERYLSMSGHRTPKVTLSGVLANHAVSQSEWTFVLSLVDGKSDSGLVSNIKMGAGVPASGKKGSKDYQPAIVPQSLTCWHCTQRGANFTVFFRWVDTNPGPIIVIGYGSHKGKTNTKYEVDWADGTSTPVDLDQSAGKGSSGFLTGIGKN